MRRLTRSLFSLMSASSQEQKRFHLRGFLGVLNFTENPKQEMPPATTCAIELTLPTCHSDYTCDEGPDRTEPLHEIRSIVHAGRLSEPS